MSELGIVGIGWRALRHTLGTMLAEMGEHQLTIRDCLRHSNLHVTNKYPQATAKSSGWRNTNWWVPAGLLSGSKSKLIQ